MSRDLFLSIYSAICINKGSTAAELEQTIVSYK